MDDQLEIIFHEYNTIFSLRERCIKNIEESIRTYLIFLGFNFTAFSIIAVNDKSTIILFGVLLIGSIVGFFIYESMINTHINFIFYSRKLNLTREYFLKWRRIKKYIFLPISGEEPKFDEIGMTGKKFSKSGLLIFIPLLNSAVAAFFCYYLLIEIFKQILNCQNIELLFALISFIVAFTIFHLHSYVNDKQIVDAKNKWETEMKNRINK